MVDAFFSTGFAGGRHLRRVAEDPRDRARLYWALLMNVARVIGTIWATRKHPDLEGAKITMVQPLSCDLDPIGRPLAAVDTIGGAGEGDLVYYVTAYEAVIPFFRPMVPIDASIVGIIDSIDHDPGALEALRTAKLPRKPAKGGAK